MPKKFDISAIIIQIEKAYSEEDITTNLDEEILNWIDHDSMQEDGYENEYEWYSDYGRGEAETVVIKELIDNWVCNHNKGKKLEINQHCKLYSAIQDKFDCLKY